jgi:hypothetical protein
MALILNILKGVVPLTLWAQLPNPAYNNFGNRIIYFLQEDFLGYYCYFQNFIWCLCTVTTAIIFIKGGQNFEDVVSVELLGLICVNTLCSS